MEPDEDIPPHLRDSAVARFSLKVGLKSGQTVGYTGEVAVRVEYGALIVSRDGEIISGYSTGAWESFSIDNP